MEDFSTSQPKLPIRELAAQITELAGHLNAGNHRWLTLIAEFDRRNGWSDGSTQSCAHWLNWQCGINMGAAREKVRVAHALEQLPTISASMSRGELSYSKVRAITRIATAANEDFLLSMALHGTASHVEKLVRSYRRAEEAEMLSRDAAQRANRHLSYLYDDDGSLVVKARLPAEIGALLIKAIELVNGRMPYTDVSAETLEEKPKPSFAARRADALGKIMESFLAHGEEAMSGGDRTQIVVHVDATTLQNSAAGRCELEQGPSLPAETVRRLACDASVVAVIENDEGEVLNVGRKTRTIPPAIRRAINARDRGCRFPGCSNTRYVDAHHIHHWANGGETKASNLVTLCRFHHRQVHEGNVVVQTLDDGAVRFTKPDGSPFDSVAFGFTPPLSDWTQLTVHHREHGPQITKTTAMTRWRGETMDYTTAIRSLLFRAKKALDVSAEIFVAAENHINKSPTDAHG